MPVSNNDILKTILLNELDRMEPETSTFEDDPMQFILKKYAGLKNTLEYLMTPSFEEYITGIYVVAPKPTTFKVVLHNGQFFFLQFMGKAYEATVEGRKYYLMSIGEKERCMIAISRLLRYGNPLKTKGPDGAEQATRDSEGPTEEAGPTPPAEPTEEGGEELTESTILKAILSEQSKSSPKINQQAVDKLIDTNPGKFDKQSNPYRIANKEKMSPDDFVKIIKKSLKAKNIVVHPPKSGPNDSSKFSMFEFESEFGPVRLVLSGGASANLGSKFEKELVDRIKSSAGLKINDIEDPVVKKILDELGIDSAKLKPENVIAAGETDTKRPLNFKGPQNRGEKISDIVINYKNRSYYLSIKNVSGSGIYNGGVIPGIVFNKDKTKIIFDKQSFEAKEDVKSILDIFGVDPKKIVSGLNNYVNQTGSDTSFVQTNGNLESIKKLLGSAIDYGYYYIREIPGGDVKIYNIDSAKKANQLLGTPTGISVKYPSKSTKITTIRVPLEDSLLGLKRADVSIRNATGGVDKLTTATGAVSVAGSGAPESGQVLTATGSTTATWQTPASGGVTTGKAIAMAIVFGG